MTTNHERLLTRREFMDETGIGPCKQRQLEKAGRLRSVTLGKRTVRIPSSEIARIAQGAK